MEKELIQKAWFQASNEAIYWNKMSNDRITEITKQLLAVASLLIPITGSIVLTKIHLNETLKTVLCGSLIFLLFSIIFGFIDIYVAVRFFRRYTAHNASRAIIYYKHLNNTLDQAEKEIQQLAQPQPTSNDLFAIFQYVSIGIGILLLFGVIITLLITK